MNTSAPVKVMAANGDISLDHPRRMRTDPDSASSLLRSYAQ